MKRIPTVALLCVLALTIFISISDAQRPIRRAAHATPSGKIAVPCPDPLDDITDCPDTGCGPSLDPLLNKQKNIRSDDQEPVFKTLQQIKNLPDPVPGFAVGDPRGDLADLGEGKKITVVAFALVARKGGAESCNCKLTKVADTDNHIVLVGRAALNLTGENKKETLHLREQDSITAEFAPRPRLDSPHLTRANLQPLIDAARRNALLVRITGLLMFDSEHSLGHHLKRHNNWEVHPVLELEYCPKGKRCSGANDDNWTRLGDEP